MRWSLVVQYNVFHSAVNHPPVLYSQYIPRAVPEKDKQGLDEVRNSLFDNKP